MNDFFKYFDKLDSVFKSTIIGIAVLMPFWYISIYLINEKLFFNLDFTLRIAFCFCFSTVLYFCQLSFLIIDMSLKNIEDFDGRFKLAGFLGVFYLCCFITVHYHTDITYKKFLYSTFIYIVIINTCSILVDYLLDKKSVKK